MNGQFLELYRRLISSGYNGFLLVLKKCHIDWQKISKTVRVAKNAVDKRNSFRRPDTLYETRCCCN